MLFELSQFSDLNGVLWYDLILASCQCSDCTNSESSHWTLLPSMLDERDNLDLWYRFKNILTAMQRRILITHWACNSWTTLCSPDYENLRKQCWEETRYLMTTDGFEDNKITPEGLNDYKILPQLNLPTIEAEPEADLPNSLNGEDEDYEEVLDRDIEHPPNEGLDWDDFEIDRSYDDKL